MTALLKCGHPVSEWRTYRIDNGRHRKRCAACHRERQHERYLAQSKRMPPSVPVYKDLGRKPWRIDERPARPLQVEERAA